MPTQRSDRGRGDASRSPGTTASRRAALGAVAGVVTTGGCVGTVLRARGGRGPVSVLAAGSLQRTCEDLRDVVEPTVRVEAHGSVTVARLVAEGKRDPDVVALADADLFDALLDATWHARFATNALVVAYAADSPGGRRVAAADRWFDPVLDGGARLGRTDPDLDPLGYRTLFMLALAERRHDRPGLRERLLAPDQVYPETSLMGRFETGEVDAAVVYRTMAVERGYDYRDLPPAVDLSDPDRDDAYAAATYTLPDGRTARGEHISYGVQARTDDAATAAVFDAVVDGSVPADHGFGLPERLPTFEGDVPRAHR